MGVHGYFPTQTHLSPQGIVGLQPDRTILSYFPRSSSVIRLLFSQLRLQVLPEWVLMVFLHIALTCLLKV
jgi:hypothetical protein